MMQHNGGRWLTSCCRYLTSSLVEEDSGGASGPTRHYCHLSEIVSKQYFHIKQENTSPLLCGRR